MKEFLKKFKNIEELTSYFRKKLYFVKKFSFYENQS